MKKKDETVKVNIDKIKNTHGKLILYVTADWCSPCKTFSPIMEMVAQEDKHIKIKKIDVDEFQKLSKHLNVKSIPTLIFFNNGYEVNRMIGPQSKNKILEGFKF